MAKFQVNLDGKDNEYLILLLCHECPLKPTILLDLLFLD